MAVNIIPINTFCNIVLTSFPLLNILAIKNPPARGIITPSTAIINDALPVFFNWLISVSKPAVNISTITPNSASFWINSVSDKTFKTAGPKITPATKAPTTCGILTFLVINPNSLVLIRISAKSNKNS